MQQATLPGTLISFEGGEGCGKTTQVARIVERLQNSGHEVLSLREPGGTEVSEQIRAVVLSGKNKSLCDETEVLLFQAARAQIYQEVVLPALQAGKLVLMDRTRDSSVVYQGIVRGFGIELIEQLNSFSTKNTLPSLTVLLDVSATIGLGRRQQEGGIDRIDGAGQAFHEQVNQAYKQLAAADPTGRWVVVDANQAVDAVTETVWKIVSERINR